MNKDLKKVFVAIKDNKVVVFDTNLKGFIERLKKIESQIRNYAYYSRQFEKEKIVEFINNGNEKYYLQQVYPV